MLRSTDHQYLPFWQTKKNESLWNKNKQNLYVNIFLPFFGFTILARSYAGGVYDNLRWSGIPLFFYHFPKHKIHHQNSLTKPIKISSQTTTLE